MWLWFLGTRRRVGTGASGGRGNWHGGHGGESVRKREQQRTSWELSGGRSQARRNKDGREGSVAWAGRGRASRAAHIGGAGMARVGGREEEGQRDASRRQLPCELGHTQLATCPS